MLGLASAGSLVLLAVSAAATVTALAASFYNYPGADAMTRCAVAVEHSLPLPSARRVPSRAQSCGLSAAHAEPVSRGVCCDVRRMHAIADPQSAAVHRVHIDVAAAETGVSRFFEVPSQRWQYSKEETLTCDPLKTRPEQFDDFEYLVTPCPDFHSQRFEV